MDCKGKGEVYEGEPKRGKSDLTITLAEETFMDMVSGKLNGQQVKLKLSSISNALHVFFKRFTNISLNKKD